MRRNKHQKILKIDPFLLVSVLALVLLGAAFVFSASSYIGEKTYSDSSYFIKSHLAKVLIGLVLMIIVSLVDYRRWLGFAPIVFLSSIFMLLLLFTNTGLVLDAKNGVHRWLDLKYFTLQCSDFARYALIMFLARYLVEYKEEIKTLKGYVTFLGIIGFIVLLIALEPDFGTAAIILMIAFFMLFLADVRLSYLITTGLLITPVALAFLSKHDYMIARLQSYIDILFYKQTPHYQVQQSLISFGLGGFWGQGAGNSHQKYEFLPEAHKDFIFSIIGEEAGFLGTLLILFLFAVLVYRGLKIAQNAPDTYGKLLAGGITFSIGIYAFLHASVAIALIPTTGIPMPFISYGGSAMITHLAALGLLLNISAQCKTKTNEAQDWNMIEAKINLLPFAGTSRQAQRATRQQVRTPRNVRTVR